MRNCGCNSIWIKFNSKSISISPAWIWIMKSWAPSSYCTPRTLGHIPGGIITQWPCYMIFLNETYLIYVLLPFTGNWGFYTILRGCIKYSNVDSYSGRTLEQCRDLCVGRKDFFCRSFDWSTGGTCHLSADWPGNVPANVSVPCYAGTSFQIEVRELYAP